MAKWRRALTLNDCLGAIPTSSERESLSTCGAGRNDVHNTLSRSELVGKAPNAVLKR